MKLVRTIENHDLVWIATLPDLQLKILKLLGSFPDRKIIIEKPISINNSINKELFSMFSSELNLFISRPWNFSKLWLHFKENIKMHGEIKSLFVEHSGEILRDYINPPQDWLHHDICLIQELNLNFGPHNPLSKIIWSNNHKNISINIGDGSNIEIQGGFSAERISIFEVFLKNGSKIKMDMNNRNFLIQTSDGKTETIEVGDDLPVNSMAEQFINTEINETSRNNELKILQELQILSI